jgi:hypothetical protein
MTASEKAKAGLWLLKESVLQYLEDFPDGISARTAAEDLGLKSKNNSKDTHLFWGLENLLTGEGKICSETREGGGRTRHIKLVSK